MPDAPLRAREPHSAPQHSAARRLPREPLAASHRPPTALSSRRRPVAHGVAGAVRRPSATVAIGSCEPEAAHSAALPVREPHSVPQTADRRERRRRRSSALTEFTLKGRTRRASHGTARSQGRQTPWPPARQRRFSRSNVTSLPAMTTLSRRHAVHHAAETVQRPSDAQVISSCAHEAVPSAALPVREPHSVPQPAAARRSPRGSPEALQPLQRTCPLRASCRAQRGRGGP